MSSESRIGEVLAGTYRIESLLGEGGMGTVYEVAHLRVPRRFAVKVLNREVVGNRDIFERFRREAEIASAIGNKHIVQVLDFNHCADGSPYMVLELLRGEDLSQRIARLGRLDLLQTTTVVVQICDALSAAHAAGIVHRDLKPGNVFLIEDEGRDDFVKVLDFGISKVLHGLDSVTRTGVVFGTPQYMAPEQAQGKPVDARTDLFSLGSIIFECLTGRPAFEGETPFAVAYKVCHEPATPLRSLAPDLPEQVERVVLRAMAKPPEGRYAGAGALADDFLRASGMPSRAVSQPMPARPASRPNPKAPRTAMAAEARRVVRYRARGQLALAGGLAGAIAVAVGWIVYSGRPGEVTLAVAPAPPPATPEGPPPPVRAPAPADAPSSVQAALATAEVLVTLRLTPPDARVELDGVERKDNPLRLSRANRTHALVVSAAGHVSAAETVRADSSQTYVFALQRKAASRPVSGKRGRVRHRVRGPMEKDL